MSTKTDYYSILEVDNTAVRNLNPADTSFYYKETHACKFSQA